MLIFAVVTFLKHRPRSLKKTSDTIFTLGVGTDRPEQIM